MSNPEITTLFNQLKTDIKTYQNQFEAGEIPLLDGVQQKVGEICNRIQTLPVEEGVKYTKELQSVMDAFNALADVLTAKREETVSQINSHAQRKTAHTAYTKGKQNPEQN